VTDIVIEGGEALLGGEFVETSLRIEDGEIGAAGARHGRASLGLDASGLDRAILGRVVARRGQADAAIIATRTNYGETFASSVWRDNVFATQFHPEKSQKIGLQLLKNFVELAK